jgi:hypothetical protein
MGGRVRRPLRVGLRTLRHFGEGAQAQYRLVQRGVQTRRCSMSQATAPRLDKAHRSGVRDGIDGTRGIEIAATIIPS